MAQAGLYRDYQKEQYWHSANLWYVALFYFFQGYYFFGSGIYILTMMANWKVPVATQSTVIAIIGLPLYLKMIPGLLSDRIPIGRWGRRKPYIAFGGILYLPGCMLVIAIQKFNILWLSAILICLVAWMLVDSTLDAMTVDITPKGRVAKMQGAAWGSRLIGMAVTSLVVPLLGPRIGWTPVLVMLGSCALIQTFFGLLVKEIPVTQKPMEEDVPLKRVISQTLGDRLVWISLLFFMFFSASRGFVGLINVYLLTELGWNGDAGMMQTYGLVSFLGLVSAAIGALLVARLTPKTLTSFKFYLVYIVGFWLLTTPWLLAARYPNNLGLIITARILVEMGKGVGTVLSLALSMRVCPKAIEGFTFALLIAASSFGEYTLGVETVSSFEPLMGGLVQAFFVLIPYGLLSLALLSTLLKELKGKEAEMQAVVAVV